MSLLNHPLEKIFRKVPYSLVESVKNALTPQQRLVVLTDAGEPVDKRKWGFFERKPKPQDLLYFLVTAGTRTDYVDLQIHLKSKELNRSVGFNLTYRLTCREGSEETVAKLLHKAPQPGKAVDEALERWVQAFEERLQEKDASLLKAFYAQQEPLVRHLVSQLEEEYGLGATIQVALPAPGPAQEPLDLEEFAVRLADFDHDFPVAVRTELKLDPDRQFEAIASNFAPDDYRRVISQAIKTATERLPLTDFLFLLPDTTASRWISPINEILAAHGRKISRLELTPARSFRQVLDQPLESGPLRFSTTTLDNRIEIDVSIHYQARCQKHQAAVAVRALLPGDPVAKLKEAIREFVERWMQDTYGLGKPVADTEQTRGKLETDLRLAFEKKYGLEMSVFIDISGKGSLAPVKVNAQGFGVKFPDVNDETLLRFEAELEVDASRKSLALLVKQDGPRLADVVTQQVRASIANGAALRYHDLYFNRPELERKLTPAVNEVLQPFGRQVSYLKIEPVQPLAAPAEFSHDHRVSCKIKNYPTPIYVDSSMLLSLADAGRLRTRGIANVAAWLNELLDRMIQNHFFDKTYVGIITQLDACEEALVKAIRDEVEKTGYTIRQHVVVPGLPHLRLKQQGFRIDREADFATSDSRLRVKLQLILRGDIPNLGDIEHLLNNPEVDVEKIEHEIYEAARDVVEERLHVIPAQEFYLHFDVPPPADEPAAVPESVRANLTRLVEERFGFRRNQSHPGSTFGVRNLKVTIKQSETELIKRLDALRQKRHRFVFDVVSWGDLETGKTARFSVEYSVKGVDPHGWYLLQNKSRMTLEEQIEDTNSLLRQHLQVKLETVDLGVLQYEHFQQYTEIVNKLVRPTSAYIARESGLLVDNITLKREMTAADEAELEMRQKLAMQERDSTLQVQEIMHRHANDKLQDLLDKRNDLISGGYTEDNTELKAIEEEIERYGVNPTATRLNVNRALEKPARTTGTRKDLNVFSLDEADTPKATGAGEDAQDPVP